MENKYYIPQIEEFYVGFEYEFQTLKGWEKRTFNSNDGGYYNSTSETKEGLSDGNIRVKFLDRQDIEAEGFESYGEFNHHRKQIEDYDAYFYITPYGNKAFENGYIIESDIVVKNADGSLSDINSRQAVWFMGDIRNASELRTILKQIRVIKSTVSSNVTQS